MPEIDYTCRECGCTETEGCIVHSPLPQETAYAFDTCGWTETPSEKRPGLCTACSGEDDRVNIDTLAEAAAVFTFEVHRRVRRAKGRKADMQGI